MKSPVFNYCLKVILDYQIEPQIVPKLLLHVSVRELHNSLVIDTKYGGLKEAMDEENNIIISDSKLRKLLLQQLKQMTEQYKVVCGCECCISAKSIHPSLLSLRDWYLKKLKDQNFNNENIRSGEK